MKNQNEQSNSVLVGLTGQSGAGKTTVSGLLKGRGFQVIDADQVARQVVEKGTRCLLDLTLAFGVEILEADGGLNRGKLGDIVFQDKEKRRELGRIIFPYIIETIFQRVDALRAAGEQLIFLDAPTLFESGTDKKCDKVVSVIAPRQLRLDRLRGRDTHRTLEELEHRVDAQYDDEFYFSRSDFVIRNEGKMTDLRMQVVEMLEHCFPGFDWPNGETEE